MYIPHQGQQTIHRDIVSDGLRRSELRRALRQRKTETSGRAKGRKASLPLTTLVRNVLGSVARPG